MIKVTKIQISGFRRLREISLETRPLTVLIGSNGVGKTSLLDVLSLFSASASGRLSEVLSSWGGLPSILTRKDTEELILTLNLSLDGAPDLHYALTLSSKGTLYFYIKKEILNQQDPTKDEPIKHIDSASGRIGFFDFEHGKFLEPTWEHNAQETSLSQVPKMFQQSENIRRILSSIRRYHSLDVSPNAAIRRPQQMRPVNVPAADGGDLIPFLYYLRETNKHRFDSILDSLKSVFPELVELTFPPVAAGLLTMTWLDRRYDQPFYLNELSEGTLRYLWIVSILQGPDLATITMFDEPEVSLHPELLGSLADLFREASSRTQVIVATHSDRLVRFLQPAEVVVCDIEEDGFASLKWADELDLGQWLADYSFDELWRMGIIGGRA